MDDALLAKTIIIESGDAVQQSQVYRTAHDIFAKLVAPIWQAEVASAHILIGIDDDPFSGTRGERETLIVDLSREKKHRLLALEAKRPKHLNASSHPLVQLSIIDYLLGALDIRIAAGYGQNSRNLLLELAALAPAQFFTLMDCIDGKKTIKPKHYPLTPEKMCALSDFAPEVYYPLESMLKLLRDAMLSFRSGNDLVQTVVGANLVGRLDIIKNAGVRIVAHGGRIVRETEH